MRRMQTALVLIGFGASAFLAAGSCGNSGGAASNDAAVKADAPPGSGGGPGGGGGATGGSGTGGTGTAGTGTAGKGSTGGIAGTGGATATGGISGTGGTKNVCAGKGSNCRPFPEGCQGAACTSCPCEGGTGGVMSSGGAGGGGTTSVDAAGIDSCFDDQGAIKPAMKACMTAGDCRQDRDIYCCGSDRMVGLASTARCQLNNPDCSNRGCMKWTYVTAEDGTTTEHGGVVAVACLAGRCSTYLAVPSSLDGSVFETPIADALGRF